MSKIAQATPVKMWLTSSLAYFAQQTPKEELSAFGPEDMS